MDRRIIAGDDVFSNCFSSAFKSNLKSDLKSNLKAYLLDLAFPNRCPFCGEFIAYDILCCEKCFHEALWADENICTGCGKSLLKGCICGNVSYDGCYAAAYYADSVRDCIHNLKFHGNTNGADIFGRVLRDRLETAGVLSGIDLIVPVPMTSKQKRERGYDQAELIARAISAGEVPVEDVLCRKHVKTSQHLLGAEERRSAVGKQYSATERDLSGMTVLLADDVITTGSNLSCCASLLKQMGAARVICAAAATA